jgi:hypothetical protein
MVTSVRTHLARGLIVGLFALVGAVAVPSPAHADNPWIIVVSGPLLREPVVIDDWKDNYILLTQEDLRIPASKAPLEGRTYLEMHLFWGPAWAPGSLSIPRRAPAAINADGHGRFYPASGGRSALVVLDASTAARTPERVLQLGADGEEVLARHGVPLTVASAPADSDEGHRVAVAAAGGAVAVVAALAAWWLVSRRRASNGLSAAA